MKRAKTLLMILGVAAFVALFAASGQSSRPKPKRLRAEIAELKSMVAQLQSQLDYQMRRDAAGGIATSPIGGLCSDPCAVDSDGDGEGDCEDLCPCDPTTDDSDGDGVPNCADPCPDDATDACIDPCRQDSDGDGVTDCGDPCPWDPGPAKDADEDGIPDCADPCPENKDNDCTVPCPLDADGDGTKDCIDPCPYGDGTMRPCILSGPGGKADGPARR